MIAKTHYYQLQLKWTGNLGKGTSSYSAYLRDHELTSAGKPTIQGSSDPAFRGDSTRYNPEELLVASLSSCHMLWFLHLCADSGIVVTSYEDAPEGTMTETPNGGGHFTEVMLKPSVAITDVNRAHELEGIHEKAHGLCFIANSVNFPVKCQPTEIQITKG